MGNGQRATGNEQRATHGCCAVPLLAVSTTTAAVTATRQQDNKTAKGQITQSSTSIERVGTGKEDQVRLLK